MNQIKDVENRSSINLTDPVQEHNAPKLKEIPKFLKDTEKLPSNTIVKILQQAPKLIRIRITETLRKYSPKKFFEYACSQAHLRKPSKFAVSFKPRIVNQQIIEPPTIP